MFHRPRRRFPRRPGPVRPVVRRALVRAHRALEQGDTEQAARIFLRLSRGAFERGMGLRAAGLLLEAAHAEALGGRAEEAVRHAGRALTALPKAPLPDRMVATAERLVEVLRQGGHEAEAEAVEGHLEERLREAGSSRQDVADRLAAGRAERRGELPAKCPSCAGPLLPNEVEWHNEQTAECPYCGSVVKAE